MNNAVQISMQLPHAISFSGIKLFMMLLQLRSLVETIGVVIMQAHYSTASPATSVDSSI